MNNKFLKLKGFTLIELLVVISILGVLAGLIVSNMAGARERARDAQRKSDLKEIQNALEMYKQDQDAPLYPTAAEFKTVLESEPVYMKEVPEDPLGGWPPYFYETADQTDYTLRACLENASDPQGIEAETSVCESGKKFELNAP
ncbi:MAG TPA: prepilin-type N-terminal cleavage/methylation domain-containing protein [Clostridia bacterium]|nr:prepilin-type N-terminal cleavage/methylation domain-containing protein [Clostridia bacterium]